MSERKEGRNRDYLKSDLLILVVILQVVEGEKDL